MRSHGNASWRNVAEAEFIERLRAFATDPAARGLNDDAAVLGDLVLTHDMIVEGVHFLPRDPPAQVAWKLVAVNLSDLAAKGADPIGVLMGYAMTGDDSWDHAFATGLAEVLDHFRIVLLGGDTVSMPAGSPRAMGLTAIGRASGVVPSRCGAGEGDALFVTGSIGDAGLGLQIARGDINGPDLLLAAYRTPTPMLQAGRVLAPGVTAMMDVSDGLLIDAKRMATASGCAISIDLDAIPLSMEFLGLCGDDRQSRLSAASAGDDYALLFTSALPLPPLDCSVTRIGSVRRGQGLFLYDSLGAVPLPNQLGWLHGQSDT
jgi:thiamine-monophosphate kinase